MKKKIVALGLAAVMALSMTGCGSSKAPSDDKADKADKACKPVRRQVK